MQSEVSYVGSNLTEGAMHEGTEFVYRYGCRATCCVRVKFTTQDGTVPVPLYALILQDTCHKVTLVTEVQSAAISRLMDAWLAPSSTRKSR